MNGIRLFSLTPGDDEDNTLLIEDLDVPQSVANGGARVVSLSPDRRWLSIIRPNNDIYLAKLSPPNSPDETLRIHPTLLRVQRTSGKAPSLRGVTQGTLGNYDRTIRSVAFSSDSKLVATGDLSGFVDCWMLEKAPEKQLAPAKKASNGTVLSDDESSDEEDENETEIDGQHWKHLPPMPSLRSGIAFMSFRPETGVGSQSAPVEDRLVVVTSTHELVEYETLKGKFSEWSQQNPKSHLPEDFTYLKDRVMGGFCDVFQGSTKLLLYGPTWMWIFDLTRNMPSPKAAADAASTEVVKASNPQKRKRTVVDESKEELMKYNSGAGSLIPASQATVSMGTKIRKIEGKNLNDAQWVDVEKHRHQRQNDDDDVDGTETGNPFLPSREPDFAHLRREIADDEGSVKGLLTYGDDASKSLTNGASLAGVVTNNTNADGESDGKELVSQKEAPPMFWHSHRFRDILGVVPLGSQGGVLDKEAVELAVVERPMWDLDLGDRYVKDYE